MRRDEVAASKTMFICVLDKTWFLNLRTIDEIADYTRVKNWVDINVEMHAIGE